MADSAAPPPIPPPPPPPPASEDVISRNPLSVGVIIGICIGVSLSLFLATCAVICVRLRRVKPGLFRGNSSERKEIVLPMRVNGADSSTILSDSDVGNRSPSQQQQPSVTSFLKANKELNYSAGILPFSYKELQKATNNFTTLVGRGAFGPVFKAVRPTGPVLAVKVLDVKSKQGGREFQTEVLLLGRLHHRNLVNLVGYCAERGHCMLVYEFMSGGNLAEILYNEERAALSWKLRVSVAHDISRGIEYLHDGAVPPVIHRDIKSSNILLDAMSTAKVADFGLSKEMTFGVPTSAVKGTFGYVDPQYLLTNVFTEKSDVYSFGILLFELITGRNPQQGLLDYVKLAALGVEGADGWGELVDPRLEGHCNLQEFGQIASIAFRCVNEDPRHRPKMRDVSQWLSRVGYKGDAASGYIAALAPVPEAHPEETDVSDVEFHGSPS
ncbi:hypothetical protein SELMODRAFT_174767 [Selaginella moellendorffii]|nr:hypothetical protein SELMODRAFT_174767 [Selaginella moellendorffii]